MFTTIIRSVIGKQKKSLITSILLPPLKVMIRHLGLLVITCTSLSVTATSVLDVEHQTITIWSQGVRLAGDIYKPKGLSPTAKLPGILMVPGWGGSKNNIGEKYAPHYAEKGFVVLTFDFKSWGESEGYLLAIEPLTKSEESKEVQVKTSHVRDIVNPFAMSADVRAALHYLGGEPQVMPNNLGIWGTSMGGGLALVAAASDERIQALVTQMGPVNYQYNLRAFTSNKMRQIETLTARGIIPPFPGPESRINPLLKGFPDWVAMKRFDPLSYVDKLNAPILIIDAEEESLFEREKNGQLMHEMIKDRIESRYITFPGKHYDMYKDKNLKAARYTALQWFVKHLKKE